ncbi:MAG: MraY family glycosyltransferase [Planctomycetota bacterium]|nr:MraY family glycosyltransferase [Planctomycetota bacterium]
MPSLAPYAEGLRQMTPLALVVLVGMTVLHVVGVVDDRKPLRPGSKLATMCAVATAIAMSFDTRLLTLLDKYPGGYWLSVLVTVVWIVGVINALNLIDNMDGLSGGVACIAAICFMAAALLQGQWFVAACLALLVGALLGFLVFNVPPASVFMGDGGSLVVGFWLAFLTVRTTYVQSDVATAHPTSGAWYGVFMPILVLAVPLYDTASVMLLRWSQGKPLMVGDLQHVSHRLVRRGLSKRGAVLALWGFTLVTGLAGVVLAHVPPWCAALIGGQTLVLLGVLGAIEFASDRGGMRKNAAGTEA